MKKLLCILISVIFLVGCSNNTTETVENSFSKEYPAIAKDNVFVEKNSDEIIKILENGTGVVYIGFPECKWCQEYVIFLDEVARNTGIDKISYLNILEERSENTENYQKIVSLLNDNLLFDADGNPRVYVPDVTFVVDGEIIGHDNESSVVTEADGTPEEYWTEERTTALKEKLENLMLQVIDASLCGDCNIDLK